MLKINNLEEMDKFLENHKPSQDEVQNLNNYKLNL